MVHGKHRCDSYLAYGLLLLACYALPLTAAADDLLAVYEYALQNDPQYQQASAVRRAAQEQRPQAIARLLPALVLKAETARIDQDIKRAGFGTGGELRFNSSGYRLALTQPVFRGDRLIGLRQAGSRIAQAEAEWLAAGQDLILRTTAAYFNVLAAEDTLSFASIEKRSLNRRLEQARQRFEVGLTAITDVQEAQAGFDRAVAAQIAAQNNVDNAKEALREITGAYFSGLAALDYDIGQDREKAMPLPRPNPDDMHAWTAAALEQNLAVMAALYAVDAGRDDVKREFAGHLPTLDIIASHGLDKSGGRFGAFESTATTIGLELNMPLFQGGLVNSRVRAAQQRVQERLQALEQARRAAQRRTRQAFLGVISGISRVAALEQAVRSSETALQATQAGFEVGTRTAVDVVAAERLSSQAQRDLARARYDYLLDGMRLKQAAGTLAVDDLAHINAQLE